MVGEFTQLLDESKAGDKQAWSGLMTLVYADLRRLAHRHVLRNDKAGTLGTTGVVHESYIRLCGKSPPSVQNRSHFLNLASRVMRQVLCDYAREKLRQKRGGGQLKMDLEALDAEVAFNAEAVTLIQLDDLLTQLEKKDERCARVFECRYFAGLNDQDTADALGITLRTAQRDWQSARHWLASQLQS